MNLLKKTRDSIIRFLKNKKAQGFVGRPKDLAQDQYFSLKSNAALDQNTNGAFNPFPRGYVFPRDKSQDVIVQPVALVDPFNFPNNPRALGNAMIIGSPSAPGTVQAAVAAINSSGADTILGLWVNAALQFVDSNGNMQFGMSALRADGSSGENNVLAVNRLSLDAINSKPQLDYFVNGVNASASGSNAAQTVTIDLRNLKDIINVVMTASAGGSCTLTYSVSVDNSGFAQIGSQAANAASSASWSGLDSVLGTGAPIVSGGAYTVNIPVDPRGYRYLKIVVGAGGVGSVSTLTVSCK